jgi:hypothetical protein
MCQAKASRLSAGYCAPEVDRGMRASSRTLDCPFRQDSQIAQRLRSRLGKTLTPVRPSQKLVVLTYWLVGSLADCFEQIARPRNQLASQHDPGDQCHEQDHRSARPTPDGPAAHWDFRLSLPPDALREPGDGNRWRRIPSVLTSSLQTIEATAGRKAHPIPIIRESPLQTDPWLTSFLSRNGTAISGELRILDPK